MSDLLNLLGYGCTPDFLNPKNRILDTFLPLETIIHPHKVWVFIMGDPWAEIEDVCHYRFIVFYLKVLVMRVEDSPSLQKLSGYF